MILVDDRVFHMLLVPYQHLWVFSVGQEENENKT